MLTALAVDDRTTLHRQAVARFARDARRGSSAPDLLDQFADLVHAAEAAARRAATAR